MVALSGSDRGPLRMVGMCVIRCLRPRAVEEKAAMIVVRIVSPRKQRVLIFVVVSRTN
jgi:hypothetical protein